MAVVAMKMIRCLWSGDVFLTLLIAQSLLSMVILPLPLNFPFLGIYGKNNEVKSHRKLSHTRMIVARQKKKKKTIKTKQQKQKQTEHFPWHHLSSPASYRLAGHPYFISILCIPLARLWYKSVYIPLWHMTLIPR